RRRRLRSSSVSLAPAARSSWRSATSRPISAVSVSTVWAMRGKLPSPPAVSSLEPDARVNFDLSPEHELLRDTVRRFALERVAPVAEELDREKRFPYELV